MIARGVMLPFAKPLTNQAATFMLHQLQWLPSEDNPITDMFLSLVGSGGNEFISK